MDKREGQKEKIKTILEDFYNRRLGGEDVPIAELSQTNPELSETFLKNLGIIEGALQYVEKPSPFLDENSPDGIKKGDPSEFDWSDSDEILLSIPGFEIQRLLGKGSFGSVFLARDIRLDRLVAVKVIHKSSVIDSVVLKRFLSEARALAALKHDHIVTIYSQGETDGISYLCMELVEGKPLSELIQEKGPMPFHEALRIARDLSSSLTAIHQAGLVHRDIKPSNVMIDKNGITKLMDFGIARFQRPEIKMTLDDRLIGTPLYMSPEQFRGEEVDGRSDLFSLGVLLFEMLSGEMPFQGDNIEEVRRAILEQNPAPIGKYRRDLPVVVIDILERLLLKDRSKRFQTAAEVETAILRAILEKPQKSAKGFGERESGEKGFWHSLRAHKRIAAGLILFLLIVGAGSVFLPGIIFPPKEFVAFAQFVAYPDGRDIFNGDVMETGEGIQLRWKADTDLYVYVWNMCPDGICWALFPYPESPISNPIKGSKVEKILPSKDKFWRLEPPGGKQYFEIITSTRPLPGIQTKLKEMQEPEYKGKIPLEERRSKSKDFYALLRGRTRGASSVAEIEGPKKGKWTATKESEKEIITWTLDFLQKE